jgi:hypothetical protein
MVDHSSNAKVREQHFIVASNEHILRFDVTMNQLLLMSIMNRFVTQKN